MAFANVTIPKSSTLLQLNYNYNITINSAYKKEHEEKNFCIKNIIMCASSY